MKDGIAVRLLVLFWDVGQSDDSSNQYTAFGHPESEIKNDIS